MIQVTHLQPVGHSRTQPDGEKMMLLCREAGQSREETSHVVLSVPLWQTVEELADGVIRANLF